MVAKHTANDETVFKYEKDKPMPISALFADVIASFEKDALRTSDIDLMRKVKEVKERSQEVTRDLIWDFGREINRHDDLNDAKKIVELMGRRSTPPVVRGEFGPAFPPSANDYTDWVQASDNTGKIKDMMREELWHAHGLGLDICKTEVIGKLFAIAGEIFSKLHGYTGPLHDQWTYRRG